MLNIYVQQHAPNTLTSLQTSLTVKWHQASLLNRAADRLIFLIAISREINIVNRSFCIFDRNIPFSNTFPNTLHFYNKISFIQASIKSFVALSPYSASC